MKTYRLLQQWEGWLSQDLGQHLLTVEQNQFKKIAPTYFGKNTVLLGVPNQTQLLKINTLTRKFVSGPLISRCEKHSYIESDYYELPFFSGSLDSVLLPHTLEYLDNPQRMLTEACRIVKPEGFIIIVGFNPLSLWGVKKKLGMQKNLPRITQFISTKKIKNWLALADFQLVQQKFFFFYPPLHHSQNYQKLGFLEWVADSTHLPFGNLYLLIAKAKVIPLTPIRLNWKQSIGAVQISTTVLG